MCPGYEGVDYTASPCSATKCAYYKKFFNDCGDSNEKRNAEQ